MGNIVFACIGQFVAAAFFFAVGTTMLGMLCANPKLRDDWFLEAWVIGIVIYGITFVILFNR